MISSLLSELVARRDCLTDVLKQWDQHVSEGDAERAYRGMELAEAVRSFLTTLQSIASLELERGIDGKSTRT